MQSNNFILFCCTTVLLMTIDQSRVRYQAKFC